MYAGTVRVTHGTSLLDFYIEHSDQLQTCCWEHLSKTLANLAKIGKLKL